MRFIVCAWMVCGLAWGGAVLTADSKVVVGKVGTNATHVAVKIPYGQVTFAKSEVLWMSRDKGIVTKLDAARQLRLEKRVDWAILAYRDVVATEPDRAAVARRELTALMRAGQEVTGAAPARGVAGVGERAEAVEAAAASLTNSGVSVEAMNAALGVALFADESLWDDEVEAIAERLRWPEASRTKMYSCYRAYPRESARILGCRPYSLALYAEDDEAQLVSMVFANKGDFPGLQQQALRDPEADAREVRAATRAQEEAMVRFNGVLKAESATMITELTGLLGEYDRQVFGQGGKMRERIYRWDWLGHSFLLSAEEDEYLYLRILPFEVAESRGRARKETSDQAMRNLLKGRVERRPNGDVVIGEIPMVDQGPKGYCVPATWERALTYMGMSADMYILARAGDTGPGGGTVSSNLRDGIHGFVSGNGRKMKNISPSIKRVDKYIDQGLPVMWHMVVIGEVNRSISARSRQREGVEDMEAWGRSLRDVRQGAKAIDPSLGGGHMCMIIGYNKETEEVCVSDSWGKEYAERWFTYEEAEALSLGMLEIIKP